MSRIWSSNIDNSTLYSTDAFWLVLILYILHIPSPKGVGIGILLGTAGVGFIYYQDLSSESSIIGGLFGIFAAFLLAILIFLTRFMVRRDPPLRIGFYNSLIGVTFFLAGTIVFGFIHGWELPNVSAVFLMIISGFIWAIALFCFLEAFYFTENHIIGAIGLFLSVFTEMFNLAVSGEIFSLATFWGILITSSGAIIVIISTYIHDKKVHKNNTHKQYVIPETIDSE